MTESAAEAVPEVAPGEIRPVAVDRPRAGVAREAAEAAVGARVSGEARAAGATTVASSSRAVALTTEATATAVVTAKRAEATGATRAETRGTKAVASREAGDSSRADGASRAVASSPASETTTSRATMLDRCAPEDIRTSGRLRTEWNRTRGVTRVVSAAGAVTEVPATEGTKQVQSPSPPPPTVAAAA